MSLPQGIVPIAGMPGESIAGSISGDVQYVIHHFPVKVTDGYAASGHAALGDHPKGLAIDVVPDPARGGTWNDVAAMVRWARRQPDRFRWIGYNGQAGHGDPAHAGANAHAHLSWNDPKGPKGGGFAPLKAAGDVAGAVGDAVGAVTHPKRTAEQVFNALTGGLIDSIGHAAARAAVTAALVIAAVFLALFGLTRLAGLKVGPPSPVKAVS